MNTRELAREIAHRANLDAGDVEKTISHAAVIVREQLRKGATVRFGKFGTFKIRRIKAKTIRNIKTKQLQTIPRHFIIDLKMAAQLKNSID